jgi:3-oxoacyl-[acyl-carrier protein] reductase
MLNKKRALITGGTSGIGKEIAKYFASHGADVAIFGTNKERGEETLKELQKHAVNADQKFRLELVDVAQSAPVEQSITKILEEWGGVDILINNAGITRDSLLVRMSEEDWDKVIEVNLKSVFNTCKVVARAMMKARQGKIINVTSVVGLTGNAGQVNYAASKSGMIGFTKSLAKELASRGISVNCIAPGFIQTPMTDALSDKQREAILADIPFSRMGNPIDIAKAALFLGSDLSDYVTGQVITVDGGMVI